MNLFEINDDTDDDEENMDLVLYFEQKVLLKIALVFYFSFFNKKMKD